MSDNTTRNGVSFWHVSTVLGGSERSFLDLVGANVQVSDIQMPDKGALWDALGETSWAAERNEFEFPHRLKSLSRTQGWKNLFLIPLALLGALRFVLSAQRTIRMNNPSLIYSHGLKLHILLTPIAWWSGVPIVWHLQDFWPESRLGKNLFSILSKFGFDVICDSKAVADALPIREDQQVRVGFVHNAIDCKNYGFVPHNEHEKNLVGFVGMMAPWKGPDIFLEAAQLLLKRNEAIRFTLAGGMPYDASQADREFYSGLRQHESRAIVFTGLLADTRPVFKRIEIFCHCSTKPEPFGRVILEAMASGAIVIVADAGGPREIIVDGVDGFLCKPNDAKLLAMKIEEILSLGADEKSKIVLAARRKAEQSFSAEGFRRQIINKLNNWNLMRSYD